MNTEKMKERITITLDAITALGLLGNIDLARRHPLNTGPSVVLVRAFREQLLSKIAETGLLSSEELRQAFNEEDVDISRQEMQRRLREEFGGYEPAEDYYISPRRG